MTTSKILFDTNVLVYNQVKEDEFNKNASIYHDKVLSGELDGIIASQSILEFSAVMINPKKIIKPLSQKAVEGEINKYLSSNFKIIYPNMQTLTIFVDLLGKHKLHNNRQVFDMFLVATMLSNSVKTVLTANTMDFKYKEIKVIKLIP